jgi:transcriptional regulator with XRE-family HTH domain
MEIGERIKMVIESQKITAGVFADQIGVQRSNVSHVLSGRNKPSFEFLEKLLAAFPRVSAQWLLTGKQVPNGVELITPDSPLQQKTTITEVATQPVQSNEKKIVKTIVFYDDFTFDTYTVNER